MSMNLSALFAHNNKNTINAATKQLSDLEHTMQMLTVKFSIEHEQVKSTISSHW